MKGQWMLALLAVTASTAVGAGPTRPLSRDGELLVRLHPGVAPRQAARDLARTGLTLASVIDPGGWALVQTELPVDQLAQQVLELRAVASIEPNYYVERTGAFDPAGDDWVPDDPYFARQWNLRGMPEAWRTGRGDTSVVVAVLDTGLHLTGGERPAVVVPGWDVVNGDADPDDDNGHGTHITSIIAQATDNGILAAGLAPGVSVMPVKVLDAAGVGTVADVAAGIYWATDAGADVINLSLAMPPFIAGSGVLHDALRYAAERGVILVASAGNHGASTVSYPAAYTEVIAVGATASDGSVAAYSNGGAALDLVAPGGDGVDRDGDGFADAIAAFAFDPHTGGAAGLYLGAGTSQAAAHVSAAAALIVSLGVDGRDRVRTLLELTAHDLEAGPPGHAWDVVSGYGGLDVAAAIAARDDLLTSAEADLDGGREEAVPKVVIVAALIRHPSGSILLARDGEDVLAIVDRPLASVGVYRFTGQALPAFLEADGGIVAQIDGAGGALPMVEAIGELVAQVDLTGGLDGWLASTGLAALLEAMGGTLALVDQAGGTLALIDAAGGLLAIVDTMGGLVEMVQSAGGVVAILESAGGWVGILEASGRFGGALEGSSSDLYPTLSGLRPIDGSIARAGRHRTRHDALP